MSGDNINIFGKSYHKKPTAGYSGTTNNVLLSELVNAFAGSGVVGGKATATQITGQSGFPTSINGLIGTQPAQNVNMPKAAINWILFDEQFKWVSGGFDMVGTATNTNGTLKNHDLSTIPSIAVTKNGYLYVWVSNESKFDVFFDNLQVVHTRGAILEETHYYPFGLTMAGISSKALAFGSPENKKKWNKGSELESKEFSDGSGLELYSTFYRSLDPQLGRFWQIDPKPSYSESVFVAMGNNPIMYNDFLGDRKVNFDENGNFINITKDNRWHNFWNGSKGRVLDKDGNVKIKFKFGDAKHDVADIKSGKINKIAFVSANDITDMVGKSGAFSSNNKVKNAGLSYINREGQGGGKLDFSYTQIPAKYPEASSNPLADPSSMLFLVQNVKTGSKAGAFDTRNIPSENFAFNHMNFGNFLFGAAGEALGFTADALQLGAQKNSLAGRANGYGPQLDSSDDQLAIKLGHNFGESQNYDKISRTSKIVFDN
jgi:RHS repeat-associated protein